MFIRTTETLEYLLLSVMKYCRHNGCSNLINDGQYCNEHERRKPKPKRYYSKNASFYKTKAWVNLSAHVRVRDKLKCTNCGKFVVGRDAQVDHILPIWLRPDLKLDMDNCRLVCAECHPIVEYKPPH